MPRLTLATVALLLSGFPSHALEGLPPNLTWPPATPDTVTRDCAPQSCLPPG